MFLCFHYDLRNIKCNHLVGCFAFVYFGFFSFHSFAINLYFLRAFTPKFNKNATVLKEKLATSQVKQCQLRRVNLGQKDRSVQFIPAQNNAGSTEFY